MASLQARHSRSCRHNWTTADPVPATCSCPNGPSYYIDAGLVGGKHVQTRAGRNLKEAQRALRRVQVAVDEESYEAPRNVAFSAWADEWLASLRRPKESTLRTYRETMGYAKRAFGPTPVRKISSADVSAKFLGLLEHTSASTQRRHLRVLHACFRLAEKRGYASRNAVALLEGSELPAKRTKERPYFENEELPRLLAEIPGGLYLAFFKVALGSGLREGELVGLQWGDVDLAENVIRVRRTYSQPVGSFETPKSAHSKRDVYVPDAIVEALGAWWGECGKPGDAQLVFPGQGKNGQLVDSTLRRVLYDALDRAGIRREHVRTGERRDVHSCRHTYAKLCLESGRPLIWLSRQLGHSSVAVTSTVYSHIEDEVRAEGARELVVPGL